MLEKGSTVGGTWARERIYPTLTTNNLLGCYEFWGYPLDPKLFDVKPGKAIPGEALHEYFEGFVEESGLEKVIRFGVEVEVAEMREGEGESGWVLGVREVREGGSGTKILARKLIIATGLTSEPFLPTFEGAETFDAPIVHSKYLKAHASTITTSDSAVVLGGTKSAWDATYAYASAGVDVHWIIRSTGHGPTWMAPPFVTPLKKQLEKLLLTRLMTWFSPCIFADAGGYGWIRRFLHGTWLGRKIVSGFFAILTDDLVQLNKYDQHPETRKLKPLCSPFWIGTSLSILNYENDFFEYVRSGKVKIHIAEIDHLEKNAVHLDNAEVLPADVLYCATGWTQKPPMKFLPEGIEDELGLPTRTALTSHQRHLKEKADSEVLQAFPILANQPQPPRPVTSLSKYQNQFTQSSHFYRFIVPPSPRLLKRRDIAFAGSVLTIATSITAQVQALWISAFFQNRLPLLSDKALRDPAIEARISSESMLWARYTALRHPSVASGFGEQVPDLAFESLPYVDVLVGDLGLRKWRKREGWWWGREWLEPYGHGDYSGLVREWEHLEEMQKERSSS